jgi:hypothetical protein
MAGETKEQKAADNPGYTKETWEKFRDSQMLWFVNTILHVFGWCILLEKTKNGFMYAVPARTSFRGFSEARNTEGYKKLTEHLANDIDELLKDVHE